MAPASTFANISEAGVLVVITDASRADSDDGLGGFAFLAGEPDTVFIMSEPWTPALKAAVDCAAERRVVRGQNPARAALSMPAAEVTASVALATAVAVVRPVQAVVTITDCAPAASAFNALCSRSAQIHQLLSCARAYIPRWLGVHVGRRLNTDADRLSHPSLAMGVVADAEAAGLRVERLALPAAVQTAAERVALLPLRYVDRSWRQ